MTAVYALLIVALLIGVEGSALQPGVYAIYNGNEGTILGFKNLPCADQAPISLPDPTPSPWKYWEITTNSYLDDASVVTIRTHVPQGSSLPCPGKLDAIGDCSSKTVDIARSNDQQWLVKPVAGQAGVFNIIENSRADGCMRYLAATPTNNTVFLTNAGTLPKTHWRFTALKLYTKSPGRPKITGVARGGEGKAAVSATIAFTAPNNTGCSPITGYTVDATPLYKGSPTLEGTRIIGDTVSASSTTTSVVVTGLLPNRKYKFTLAAINECGTGNKTTFIEDAASDSLVAAGCDNHVCAVDEEGNLDCDASSSSSSERRRDLLAGCTDGSALPVCTKTIAEMGATQVTNYLATVEGFSSYATASDNGELIDETYWQPTEQCWAENTPCTCERECKQIGEECGSWLYSNFLPVIEGGYLNGWSACYYFRRGAKQTEAIFGGADTYTFVYGYNILSKCVESSVKVPAKWEDDHDIVSMVTNDVVTAVVDRAGALGIWGEVDDDNNNCDDGPEDPTLCPRDDFKTGAKYVHGWSETTCITLKDGRASCFGRAIGEEDGDKAFNDLDGFESDTEDEGLYDGYITGVRKMKVGSTAGCVIYTEGDELECWGTKTWDDDSGDNKELDEDYWTDVLDVGITETGICVVKRDGTVDCSSIGTTGETRPIPDAFNEDIVKLDCALEGCCALRSDGDFTCWGKFDAAEDSPINIPRSADGYDRSIERCDDDNDCDQNLRVVDNVVDFAMGRSVTCYLRTDGEVTCFGGNVDEDPFKDLW